MKEKKLMIPNKKYKSGGTWEKKERKKDSTFYLFNSNKWITLLPVLFFFLSFLFIIIIIIEILL